MEKIKFMFICCALFLSSADAQSSTTEPFKDLIDLIKQLIIKAEEHYDKAISEVIGIIDGINDNWEDYRQNLVAVWAKVIQTTLGEITKFLDTVAKYSSEPGKKLVKCFDDSAADLGAVPVNFLNLTTACITSDLLKVIKLLGPLTNDLNNIKEKVHQIASSLNSCPSDDSEFSEFMCVITVAEKMLAVAGDIQEIVKTDLYQIHDDIEQLIQTITSCAKNNLDPNANNILNEIAECVAS